MISVSEKNYNLSMSLFEKISNNFYLIENDETEDTNFLIEQTLVFLKKLENLYNKIDLIELTTIYDANDIKVITGNVDAFKEAVYYIEGALNTFKIFDKLYPSLFKYTKNIEWNLIAENEENAVIKIANYLSNKERYSEYKSFINNVVKGTLKQKDFNVVFRVIINRLGKSKIEPRKVHYEIPPEMWNKKGTAWEKSIEYNIKYSKNISLEVETVFVNF